MHHLFHLADSSLSALPRNADPINTMLSRARHRAKKADIPFALSRTDIAIPEQCPVLGITLTHKLGTRGAAVYSPSLDRMVPQLGYVPGNVRVISHRANLLKNDASLEELQLVLADLERIACR